MPSTRFLFWNINRRPITGAIVDLARSDRVDIVILVECEIAPATLLYALNRERADFHFAETPCKGVRVFTRFSLSFMRPVWESPRVSMRRLALPLRSEIILAVAHLPSKLHMSDHSQVSECVELARQIADQEAKAGHQRTVVVGDFNMNPFEHGMVSTTGMHAISSRQVASRVSRTVQGRDYPFFYNPMWAHFGDGPSPTAGSYYYEAAEHVNYFWNMFDQVLLRPELAERFDSSQLKVVKAIGPRPIVRADGRPDAGFSDHLPIVFELEF